MFYIEGEQWIKLQWTIIWYAVLQTQLPIFRTYIIKINQENKINQEKKTRGYDFMFAQTLSQCVFEVRIQKRIKKGLKKNY